MRRTSALLAAIWVLALMPLQSWAGWDEANAAYEKGDWAKAAAELRPLADAGDPRAQARVGRMLAFGLGVPHDKAVEFTVAGQRVLVFGLVAPKELDMARQYLDRAADANNAEALFTLGVLAAFVDPKDLPKGLDYFRRAAAQDSDEAANLLGLLTWQGGDHPGALPYLRKAAEKNHPESQVLLGFALMNGDSVTKDAAESLTWFRKAASMGNPSALFFLAQANWTGNGIDRDPVKAYALAITATARAAPNQAALFGQVRDAFAKALPADQAEKGRALAEQWMKSQAPTNQPQNHKISQGSGFVINGGGLILTDSHVVPMDCKSIWALPDGASVKSSATVIFRDTVNDFAVLKSTMTGVPPVPFRDDKPIRSGDPIVTLGYPLSGILSIEPNVTTGVISAMNGIKGDVRMYQITAPIHHGNSGGPVVDASGNVVGIVEMILNPNLQGILQDTVSNISFATKGDLIRKFLTESGVAYTLAPSRQTLSGADVGEKVRKSLVFITCEQ